MWAKHEVGNQGACPINSRCASRISATPRKKPSDCDPIDLGNCAVIRAISAGTRFPGTPEPMHIWLGAGGVRIAGDSWGDPNGPLILLQHGGGQTRHAWKGAGEKLGAAGYCAVAFDARRHGDSDWAPDGKYGQDVMVEDLNCVIAGLGNRQPGAGRCLDGRRHQPDRRGRGWRAPCGMAARRST